MASDDDDEYDEDYKKELTKCTVNEFVQSHFQDCFLCWVRCRHCRQIIREMNNLLAEHNFQDMNNSLAENLYRKQKGVEESHCEKQKGVEESH